MTRVQWWTGGNKAFLLTMSFSCFASVVASSSLHVLARKGHTFGAEVRHSEATSTARHEGSQTLKQSHPGGEEVPPEPAISTPGHFNDRSRDGADHEGFVQTEDREHQMSPSFQEHQMSPRLKEHQLSPTFQERQIASHLQDDVKNPTRLKKHVTDTGYLYHRNKSRLLSILAPHIRYEMTVRNNYKASKENTETSRVSSWQNEPHVLKKKNDYGYVYDMTNENHTSGVKDPTNTARTVKTMHDTQTGKDYSDKLMDSSNAVTHRKKHGLRGRRNHVHGWSETGHTRGKPQSRRYHGGKSVVARNQDMAQVNRKVNKSSLKDECSHKGKPRVGGGGGGGGYKCRHQARKSFIFCKKDTPGCSHGRRTIAVNFEHKIISDVLNYLKQQGLITTRLGNGHLYTGDNDTTFYSKEKTDNKNHNRNTTAGEKMAGDDKEWPTFLLLFKSGNPHQRKELSFPDTYDTDQNRLATSNNVDELHTRGKTRTLGRASNLFSSHSYNKLKIGEARNVTELSQRSKAENIESDKISWRNTDLLSIFTDKMKRAKAMFMKHLKRQKLTMQTRLLNKELHRVRRDTLGPVEENVTLAEFSFHNDFETPLTLEQAQIKFRHFFNSHKDKRLKLRRVNYTHASFETLRSLKSNISMLLKNLTVINQPERGKDFFVDNYSPSSNQSLTDPSDVSSEKLSGPPHTKTGALSPNFGHQVQRRSATHDPKWQGLASLTAPSDLQHDVDSDNALDRHKRNDTSYTSVNYRSQRQGPRSTVDALQLLIQENIADSTKADDILVKASSGLENLATLHSASKDSTNEKSSIEEQMDAIMAQLDEAMNALKISMLKPKGYHKSLHRASHSEAAHQILAVAQGELQKLHRDLGCNICNDNTSQCNRDATGNSSDSISTNNKAENDNLASFLKEDPTQILRESANFNYPRYKLVCLLTKHYAQIIHHVVSMMELSGENDLLTENANAMIHFRQLLAAEMPDRLKNNPLASSSKPVEKYSKQSAYDQFLKGFLEILTTFQTHNRFEGETGPIHFLNNFFLESGQPNSLPASPFDMALLGDKPSHPTTFHLDGTGVKTAKQATPTNSAPVTIQVGITMVKNNFLEMVEKILSVILSKPETVSEEKTQSKCQNLSMLCIFGVDSQVTKSKREQEISVTGTLNSKGISQPTSFDSNVPSGISQPTSFDSNVPGGILQPTSFDSNVPGGISQPTSFDSNVPSGISQPTSFDSNVPGGILQPTSFDSNVPRVWRDRRDFLGHRYDLREI